MSLTKELLKKSTLLEALSDEQLGAIVTLSVNDEGVVIGQKTGELYGNIDRDITEATGLQKPQGMKTYDWMKSLLPDLKKIKDIKAELVTIKGEKTELEKKVTEGTGLDEELKKQIATKDKKIEELGKQMTADKTLLEEKTKKYEKDTFDLSFNFLSSEAEKSLTFIDAIQPNIQKVLINSAKTEILNEYEVDEIDDGKGGLRTVFKKDGVVANNADKGLEPYTLNDLYQMKLKESLKTGDPKKGANTKGGDGGQGGKPTIDVSGAKTQVEAHEAISTQIMSEGITRDSDEFQPRFDELSKENNVASLPMRDA